MSVMQRTIKPATHRGKKEILKREPQLIENSKKTLFIKGRKSSQILNDCFKDLYHLKKPDAQILQKKNNISPFEDVTPIEHMCKKLNSPMFMFSSHNKKHPHNLTMGRMFEHTLLDMVEFGVENFKSLREFKTEKISTGIKPLLVFTGELFENNHEYIRIKNLFIDMFQREQVKNIRLQGIEHVISFTAYDNFIAFRSYKILLKKSGNKIPRIEVEEIGPRMDLRVGKKKLASDDLFKQACKKPKQLKTTKKKNIVRNTLGTTLGRIHLGAQKLNTIQTRKMKGLRKTLTEQKLDRKRKLNESTQESPKKIKVVENGSS